MDPVTRSIRLYNEIGQIRKLTDFVEGIAEELQMDPALAFGMKSVLKMSLNTAGIQLFVLMIGIIVLSSLFLGFICDTCLLF